MPHKESQQKVAKKAIFWYGRFMEKKYQKIKKIVEKELIGTDAGHDIDHAMRVYNLCLSLAKEEKNVDLDVLKTTALLHDIAQIKESKRVDHARLSAKRAQKILRNFGYPQNKIDKIVHCILAHRYRTGVKPEIKEAKILRDADKLDSIGAIGVARAFIWIEKHRAKIYTDTPLKKYIKENLAGGKINGRIKDKTKHNPFLEFEIKSKRIPKKLYTKRAKKLAKERLIYMKSFFNRLKKEIKGKL